MPTFTTSFWQSIMGLTRITVPEIERVLILRDGAVSEMCGPGRHLLTTPLNRLKTGVFAPYDRPLFASHFEEAMLRLDPDPDAWGLTEAAASDGEILLVFRKGELFDIVRQGLRRLYWTDAGPWRIERHDIRAGLDAPKAPFMRMAAAVRQRWTTDILQWETVAEGHVGLLYDDNVYVRTLAPGQYAFWIAERSVVVRHVDMRRRAADVTGQELLTKDRVTIRVNLTANFSVADPVKAVSATADFTAMLHREMQQAFRRMLGALTLDQILEKKSDLDAETLDPIRARMADMGVTVDDVALKDVILPGEMRDILNQVVAAEKKAEANVIRRREETSATRALLNTAKIMADNPIMLRLKELESLESIARDVDSLVIHNGPKGLMTDVARLSDPD